MKVCPATLREGRRDGKTIQDVCSLALEADRWISRHLHSIIISIVETTSVFGGASIDGSGEYPDVSGGGGLVTVELGLGADGGGEEYESG
jgi:hypothetical protein